VGHRYESGLVLEAGTGVRYVLTLCQSELTSRLASDFVTKAIS
jgi:hypothetical protein